MDDLLEALTAGCGDCGTDQEPAGWCPAWGVRLCFVCRSKRTDTELRMKIKDKPAALTLPAETVLQL